MERPVDEMDIKEIQKGQRPPYKGGYKKGSGGTYQDAEGLALLRLRVYLSADQSSNVS